MFAAQKVRLSDLGLLHPCLVKYVSKIEYTIKLFVKLEDSAIEIFNNLTQV